MYKRGIFFLIFLMIAGCSGTLPRGSNIVNEWDRGHNQKIEIFDLLQKPQYADMHNFAALSASIYVDNDSDPMHSRDEFCKDIDINDKDADLFKYIPKGWKQESSDLLPEFPKEPDLKLKIKGLQYQVFIKQTINAPTQAVIVFRGTDKSFGDLFTDFRWVTRFIPFTWDQYDQTRALIPDLVKYIRSKYGDDVRIITTGHSLGGGLAQQALYVTPYIKNAYVFNTSSVTGFYSVEDFSERDINKVGVSIFKIHERGEVLQYLRFLTMPFTLISQFAESDPHFIELSSNFYGGWAPEQHGIKRYSCKLLAITSQ